MGCVVHELTRARPVVCDTAPPFHRHVGLPVLAKGVADDAVSARERGVDVTVRERLVVEHVRVDLVEQRRSVGVERLLDRDDRIENAPIDHDEVGRVLGPRPRLGHDDRQRIADEPGPVVGQRPERRPQQLGRRAQLHLADVRAQVPTGQHRDDAGRPTGLGRVDGDDVGVRLGAAHERGVQHAGQVHVGDVASLAGEDPVVLDAADAATDESAHDNARPGAGRARPSRRSRANTTPATMLW